MAFAHLGNRNVSTAYSALFTPNLTSGLFEPLGRIRVSGPAQDVLTRQRKFQVVKAKKDGNSGDKVPRYDPLFARDGNTVDCPVPWEQQPVNEYQMLNETGLFAWATDDILSFTIRLSSVVVGITALVGYPIASLSINAEQEFLKCVAGASCGGVLAATVLSLRLYLGWAYIGNRLLSATVDYEETGWYDGRVWVKPAEVLARDRLLGSFKVKPALLRMKITMVGLSIALATLVGVIFVLPGPPPPIEPAEDIEETLRITSKLSYSEAAARRYEPQAFAEEDDVSDANSHTQGSTLFDVCL